MELSLKCCLAFWSGRPVLPSPIRLSPPKYASFSCYFCFFLVEKGDGYIINIGDVEGVHSGPHHAAYAASKAGLYGYTMACYENLRDSGVKVVHVAPGNVRGTHMAEATEKEGGQGAIDPEDVAEACLFAFRLSKNAVPAQMEIKAVQAGRVM